MGLAGKDRRGFRDWWIQRVTAVLVAAYVIYIVAYLLTHPYLTFFDWVSLFGPRFMRIATVLVLLSILWHAWIGLWTVFTDYVKHYPTRLVLQTVLIILNVSYLLWLLDILWV